MNNLNAINALTSLALGQMRQIKLDEITEEDIEKSKGERGKKQVQKEQGVENVPEESDSGKGSEMPVLRKENKTSATAPRRRKRGKLPESGAK